MLTFLEICENIKNYEDGTRFEKYEVVNGVDTPRGLYIVIEKADLVDAQGNIYRGNKLKWDSGKKHDFNEEILNFKFKQVNGFEEVSYLYALKLIEDGSKAIYTTDCDGDMVKVKLNDDMSYDFDIDSFGDLLKRTKFYIKK